MLGGELLSDTMVMNVKLKLPYQSRFYLTWLIRGVQRLQGWDARHVIGGVEYQQMDANV